jgi:hypothetical protein
MSGFVSRILKAAPTVLVFIAFVNLIGGFFIGLGPMNNPIAAFAAALNATLVPFLSAAVLYRADQHLNGRGGSDA